MKIEQLHKSIDQIERDVTAEEHWTVRIFLSRKTGFFSLLIGLALFAPKIATQHLMLEPTALQINISSALGLFGLLIFSYGAINLASSDKSWGKPRLNSNN